MQTYSVCDVTLASSILLPELNPAESPHPQLAFTLALHSHGEVAREWFHKWSLPDGQSLLLFGRQGKGYLLRFPGLADFTVEPEQGAIQCEPGTGVPLDTVRHLLLDQVIPLVLAWQGRLVLHASAVMTPSGAIAFVGAPAWGKSTLAASFSGKGYPALTDDCLLLKEKDGQFLVVPSYPGLRLWPDIASVFVSEGAPLSDVAHYTSKKRLGQNVGLSFCKQPVPVCRIYFLGAPAATEPGAPVTIESIPARQAFVQLIEYTFLLDHADRRQVGNQFQNLSRVAALPIFYRLAFPRELSLLPRVHRAILENAGGAPNRETTHWS